MAEKIKYRATNIETKEEHIGNVDELSTLLFASTGAIYRTVSTGTRLGGVWKIEKASDKKIAPKTVNYSSKLLAEWDAVTKPYKAASARARCRQNGAVN